MGFILFKSGTITSISPINTIKNIRTSINFMSCIPRRILTSKIWIGNVKNIIAASETGIKFTDPT